MHCIVSPCRNLPCLIPGEPLRSTQKWISKQLPESAAAQVRLPCMAPRKTACDPSPCTCLKQVHWQGISSRQACSAPVALTEPECRPEGAWQRALTIPFSKAPEVVALSRDDSVAIICVPLYQ